MEIQDLHIWCYASDSNITVRTQGILSASNDDSGDVGTVAVLVITAPTQRVEVVDDAIVPVH